MMYLTLPFCMPAVLQMIIDNVFVQKCSFKGSVQNLSLTSIARV